MTETVRYDQTDDRSGVSLQKNLSLEALLYLGSALLVAGGLGALAPAVDASSFVLAALIYAGGAVAIAGSLQLALTEIVARATNGRPGR